MEAFLKKYPEWTESSATRAVVGLLKCFIPNFICIIANESNKYLIITKKSQY